MEVKRFLKNLSNSNLQIPFYPHPFVVSNQIMCFKVVAMRSAHHNLTLRKWIAAECLREDKIDNIVRFSRKSNRTQVVPDFAKSS